jgi:hypothetical protein
LALSFKEGFPVFSEASKPFLPILMGQFVKYRYLIEIFEDVCVKDSNGN